jgi:hypothetical protein
LRVAWRNEAARKHLSLLHTEKPTDVDTKDLCEGLQLVVKYTAMIVLDLGDSGAVEQNPMRG